MVHRELRNLTQTKQHRVLADEQRRILVDLLDSPHEDVEATVEELATDIERTTPHRDNEEGWTIPALRLRLHHVHLPMLDDVGFLTYEPGSNRVRRTTAAVAPVDQSSAR